jgi:hypothetical protein
MVHTISQREKFKFKSWFWIPLNSQGLLSIWLPLPCGLDTCGITVLLGDIQLRFPWHVIFVSRSCCKGVTIPSQGRWDLVNVWPRDFSLLGVLHYHISKLISDEVQTFKNKPRASWELDQSLKCHRLHDNDSRKPLPGMPTVSVYDNEFVWGVHEIQSWEQPKETHGFLDRFGAPRG